MNCTESCTPNSEEDEDEFKVAPPEEDTDREFPPVEKGTDNESAPPLLVEDTRKDSPRAEGDTEAETVILSPVNDGAINAQPPLNENADTTPVKEDTNNVQPGPGKSTGNLEPTMEEDSDIVAPSNTGEDEFEALNGHVELKSSTHMPPNVADGAPRVEVSTITSSNDILASPPNDKAITPPKIKFASPPPTYAKLEHNLPRQSLPLTSGKEEHSNDKGYSDLNNDTRRPVKSQQGNNDTINVNISTNSTKTVETTTVLPKEMGNSSPNVPAKTPVQKPTTVKPPLENPSQDMSSENSPENAHVENPPQNVTVENTQPIKPTLKSPHNILLTKVQETAERTTSSTPTPGISVLSTSTPEDNKTPLIIYLESVDRLANREDISTAQSTTFNTYHIDNGAIGRQHLTADNGKHYMTSPQTTVMPPSSRASSSKGGPSTAAIAAPLFIGLGFIIFLVIFIVHMKRRNVRESRNEPNYRAGNEKGHLPLGFNAPSKDPREALYAKVDKSKKRSARLQSDRDELIPLTDINTNVEDSGGNYIGIEVTQPVKPPDIIPRSDSTAENYSPADNSAANYDSPTVSASSTNDSSLQNTSPRRDSNLIIIDNDAYVPTKFAPNENIEIVNETLCSSSNNPFINATSDHNSNPNLQSGSPTVCQNMSPTHTPMIQVEEIILPVCSKAHIHGTNCSPASPSGIVHEYDPVYVPTSDAEAMGRLVDKTGYVKGGRKLQACDTVQPYEEIDVTNSITGPVMTARPVFGTSESPPVPPRARALGASGGAASSGASAQEIPPPRPPRMHPIPGTSRRTPPEPVLEEAPTRPLPSPPDPNEDDRPLPPPPVLNDQAPAPPPHTTTTIGVALPQPQTQEIIPPPPPPHKYDTNQAAVLPSSQNDDTSSVHIYDDPASDTESRSASNDDPASRPESHTYDDPSSRPQSHTYDDPSSRPQSHTYDDPSSRPQSHTYDDPSSRPESHTYDDPASRPQSHTYDDPASRPESRTYDDPASRPQSHTYDDPASRPQSNTYENPPTSSETVDEPPPRPPRRDQPPPRPPRLNRPDLNDPPPRPPRRINTGENPNNIHKVDASINEEDEPIKEDLEFPIPFANKSTLSKEDSAHYDSVPSVVDPRSSIHSNSTTRSDHYEPIEFEEEQ